MQGEDEYLEREVLSSGRELHDARGGQPEPVNAERDVSEAMRRFDRLRAQAPRSDYLEGLTAEGVKDELSRH